MFGQVGKKDWDEREVYEVLNFIANRINKSLEELDTSTEGNAKVCMYSTLCRVWDRNKLICL